MPLNEIDTDINEIENDSALCSDPRIGAIVTVEDNSTYVFKGKQYYKLTDDSVEDGYPRDISRDWDGLPGKNTKNFLIINNCQEILVSSILPKNEPENVNFCPNLMGHKFFVCFLREIEKNKKPLQN